MIHHELHKAKCIASFLFAQAIAEASLAISTFKAPISSTCCSRLLRAFVSMVASYSHFLIPIRHHTNLTCKSVLTQGLVMYTINDEGVGIVSSKHFWRAVFQEILFRSFKPFSFALDDVTVPSSFLFRFECVIKYFNYYAWLACRARPLGVLSLNSSPSPSPYSHQQDRQQH